MQVRHLLFLHIHPIFSEFVKKRIPRRSDVYVKIVDVVPAQKVMELKTAGLSEHAYKLIYDNITHGKENVKES